MDLYVELWHVCVVHIRYSLLDEEDPDDFVSVDIPEDLSASDISLLPPSDRE